MRKDKIKIKKYKILDYEVDIRIKYINDPEKAITAKILSLGWYFYSPIQDDSDIDKKIISTFENLAKDNINTGNFKDFINKRNQKRIKKQNVVFEMPQGELYLGIHCF